MSTSTGTIRVRPSAQATGRSRTIAAGAAGSLAAGVGIATGEVLAGLVSGAPSLVIAIGDLIIDLQPPGAKEVMAELFGTADKLVLNLFVVVVAVGIAGALGVIGRRNWSRPVVGFSIAGVVGLFAALREPMFSPLLSIVTVVIAVAMSLMVLRILLLNLQPTWAPVPAKEGELPAKRVVPMPDWDRRRFLIQSGAAAAGSVVLGTMGRYLLENRGGSSIGGAPIQLPSPSPGSATLPPGESFGIAGLTPLVVPNDQFYRIDTALLVPRVDVATWKLTVKGLVDEEVVLTYADLQAMPIFEQYVTIACVSNRVGGGLVGNAKWTGVHLRDVLAMAGVHPEATQIVGRSVDDFTVGFPTEWAMDESRDPMIALGMNDEPLPMDHGFPARLIVPGLYGYVSATKWLSEIELTTWDAFNGYWVPLGWSKEAPILTQSRIDVPRAGSTIAPGLSNLAGVAWAPDRGVTGVEVKIDDSDWQQALISTPLSKATWVQWRAEWNATPGEHRVEVRATDGAGTVQTDEISNPAPDGARGHHTVTVQVSG
ncbi:MAG: molybdopterin-dependent oxidoreductase [Candidatus Limnocylindrales bacterium]